MLQVKLSENLSARLGRDRKQWGDGDGHNGAEQLGSGFRLDDDLERSDAFTLVDLICK